MKFFNIKMCQRQSCNKLYRHKSLVSNLSNVHVECCSYRCYLQTIGFYGHEMEGKKVYLRALIFVSIPKFMYRIVQNFRTNNLKIEGNTGSQPSLDHSHV
ncbi:MAG: hypothetical protein RLZZ230_365 [Candidatus Parcubacteria bacterium]|jgi:hypothetical protein